MVGITKYRQTLFGGGTQKYGHSGRNGQYGRGGQALK
jgi:hypothetical protein